MVNEEGIYIVIRLRDEAGQLLKGVMTDAQKEADKFNKQSEKAGKSLKDNFKDAGKELRQFRQAAFGVAAVIAAITGITKEWAKHNQETKTAFDQLGLAIKETSAAIGSIFAPTITALAGLFQAIKSALNELGFTLAKVHEAWTNLFKTISYGIQYTISFAAALKQGVNFLEAHKIAAADAARATEEMANKFKSAFVENIMQTDIAKIKLEDYKKIQQDLELLFRSGQISSQEYFNGIIGGQDQIIEQNSIIAEQARAYIDLANEVANAELLNFQTRLQGQMDMFNTYKEMYMQGHADMFAFGNMLANQFYSNMSNALSSIILGEAKARDAFKAFGQAMVKAVVDYMVQQAIAFAVSKIMQIIITATTSTMAAKLASAWAPAAALASLATCGGNSVPAIIGMTAAATAAYTIAAPNPMALGGEGTVTRPTLFLAGEAGPERYNFTPLGRLGERGSMMKQTINHISISIHNPVIREEGDIDKITEEVSRKIALEAERL